MDAVLLWLKRQEAHPNTFHSYRREAERLFIWAARERGKAVSSLSYEDLMAYKAFLAELKPHNPSVPCVWVGKKLPRSHPDWRPFAGRLSPSSIDQTMRVLDVMFSFLVTVGYLNGNPMAVAPRSSATKKASVSRYLSEEVVTAVKLAISSMPEERDVDRASKHRARWLFSLLFLCGLRISEVAAAKMGDVFCRADADGTRRWWLAVLGKGKKHRNVPMTDELMVELIAYRKYRGLQPLPVEGESTPLVVPLRYRPRKGPGGELVQAQLTRAAIHDSVKKFFKLASEQAAREGAEVTAAKLLEASAHWIRHTAATRIVNGTSASTGRDYLGHESISTTNIYLHTEEDALHAAVAQAHKLGWRPGEG